MTPAKQLMIMVICTCVVATTSLAQKQASHNRASSGNANAGRMVALGGLYGEQRIACLQCHGLDGGGNSSGAFPRLAGQSEWYLYKTLQDYAAGLRPNTIMGPIAQTLTDRQMQDVAAHYSSMKAPSTSAANNNVNASTLQIGGAIAAAGMTAQGVPACNGCHGLEGRGASPIYPALAGQYAAYTRDQLLLWKRGRRGGDPMNIMEMIAKAMTDEQIDAVARYYAALPPSDQERQSTSSKTGASMTSASTGRSPYTRSQLPGNKESILGLPMNSSPRPPYLRGAFSDGPVQTDAYRESGN